MGTEMKINKLISIISVVISIILVLPSLQAEIYFSEKTNTEDIQTISSVSKKWTALYYLDVDWYSNNFDALEYWFIDEIASNENLNVVVIQDMENDPAFMYYIDENHNKILLEEMGEINMGDYEILRDFISFGKENYPADRYQLNIYNHGGAWMGACIDTTDGDQLIMDEFQKALSETGGVDILVWIGCCLMGSIEAAYELRGLVDVTVGSEDLGFMNWWDNIFDDMCIILKENPDISTIELGESIVNFIDNNPNQASGYLTMSAIDINKIPLLVSSIDELARENVKKLFKGGYRNIRNAHDNTYQLAQLEGYAEQFEVYDLKEFIQNLDSDEKTSELLTVFDDAVITECHGIDRERTNGLSIFFPSTLSRYDLLKYYNNRGVGTDLDFTKDTFWNEFILIYVMTNLLFGGI
jgi:hypothetical protein